MIFILWLLLWLFSIVHPFLNGIYLITFLEYENNHISSISLCKNINMLTMIEIVTHSALFSVLIVFFKYSWIAILVNLPVFIYHIKRFFEKSYQLDPTELYKEISSRKKEAILKIVYYVFLFAFYLFSFIRAVIVYEKTYKY